MIELRCVMSRIAAKQVKICILAVQWQRDMRVMALDRDSELLGGHGVGRSEAQYDGAWVLLNESCR